MIKGSDNSADLFAKALDHDSIVRPTEATGFEFKFGRNPLAFTVNNLNEYGEIGTGCGAPIQDKVEDWTR